MAKANFQYGDTVRVINTGSELDGEEVRVVGISIRGVVDIYILEFMDNALRIMPDGSMKYHTFTMPEPCLQRCL